MRFKIETTAISWRAIAIRLDSTTGHCPISSFSPSAQVWGCRCCFLASAEGFFWCPFLRWFIVCRSM